MNNQVFWAVVTLVVTTLINAFGVRLLSIIQQPRARSREPRGCLVFALILLIFFNPPAALGHHDDRRLENQAGRQLHSRVLVAMFMSLFVVYGFGHGGTFGEETLDAGKQAPRAC